MSIRTWSRRTWLISVSIVGHAAIGIGLFASGIWKLEKLDSDARMTSIGMMTPVMASGGNPDLPEQKFVKKEKTEKKVVTKVQWDKRIETEDKPKQVTTSGEGEGEGEGPGKGLGKGPGDQDGDPEGVTCDETPCTGVSKLPDPPKPPEPPVNVTPQIMQGLRKFGDTQIHPSRNVKNQILDDGKTKVAGTLKVCIQPSGAIGSVTMLSSTKYPEYDQQLVEAVRRWMYNPYTVNGRPIAACSAVSFVYEIK